jgi:Domain of unknown function (DUF4224)
VGDYSIQEPQVFLTTEEVCKLTGKKRPSAQIRELRRRGYKIDVNGLGEPIVAIAEATRKLVGGSAARQQEPKWDAMHG